MINLDKVTYLYSVLISYWFREHSLLVLKTYLAKKKLAEKSSIGYLENPCKNTTRMPLRPVEEMIYIDLYLADIILIVYFYFRIQLLH